MYDLSDTIVAVSSPSSGAKAIVRITGPDTIRVCNRIFSGPVSVNSRTTDEKRGTGLLTGNIAVDGELKVEAKLYLFFAPHSYTGDDVAEIHMHTNPAVTKALMDNLLGKGLHMAGPGEFTARAYLNGKIDLAQAEAVNEIVVSSNKFQLAAAEKLLAGRLAETTAKVRASLMESLSLIEAELDFSSEDIESITRAEIVERLVETKDQLKRLLAGSIRYESVIDLPAVGIAGAPYAGKSSLVNELLGKERSIVSHRRKTTRDVLTGLLTLVHCRCVLFDCAGLILEPENILDELAHQAAIEALRNSAVVVFCVDISQDPRHKSQDSCAWTEEIGLWSLVCSLGSPVLIPVATKCDLVSEQVLSDRLAELSKCFESEFLPISIKTNMGIELLRSAIDKKLIELVLGTESASFSEQVSSVALTARHRQHAGEAIENISESISELQAGNDEVAAMIVRAAYQGICDIESTTGGAGQVDEQILEKIFARFCIGK